MSKPIPLTTTLRIKRQHIVIHAPRALMDNLPLKRRTPETGDVRLVQGPVCGDADAVFYFPGGGDGVFGGEAIETAELVGGAVETPCVSAGTVGLEGEGGKGGGWWE
ncbi:hypothetical protein DSL72_002987 [Monilinia vaccinii-corymbosi]|uniref:Uncharacterized protein n=1 Tax=Monilinia vaccinii-corymbosi TaxID=61207 RepID=A0A8A3PE99_9HELO|nr:hypothetical protein DSL72_002987 [Monilinia vaccinii-corymbosi]